MPSACSSHSTNMGYCEKCHGVVPVTRAKRDNWLYLTRDCPKCGPTETLISRDARAYYEKRELLGYEGDAVETCALNCVDCEHGVAPFYVVIDVTNRCNMNCPICLANIPAMGMEFNPPIEYFDRMFRYLRDRFPGVKVDLFGGEPTCREDLVEIIEMARGYGLQPRVVTNGLKFADEKYCSEVFATRCQLMLGLDGLDPEIQSKLRKHPGSLQKKLKAIDNIEKHIKGKLTVMCTTAPGISEDLMPGLIQLCYDKRRLITRIMLIPVQSGAGPEKVDIETATIEDVEHMMAEVFPGLEFIPVGVLRRLKNMRDVFGFNLQLGGTHPNCECIALMAGNAASGRYVPASEYLKITFRQAIRELLAWDNQMGPKLDRGLLWKFFGKRGRKLHLAVALAVFARNHVRIDKVVGPKPVSSLFAVVGHMIRKGGKWSRRFRYHFGDPSILQIVILPYEEPGCLESARLKNCSVSFVCEHPETGEIDLIPFCAYFVHKNDILRKSAARWQKAEATA
jgi:7,8-dihydro-6-hydroxymethylpterin dimethyltransferase